MVLLYRDIKVDLLTYDQIYGSDKLKIFSKLGAYATITDYAILLGGYVNNNK